MWRRRTFHDCAHELRQISERFRAAAQGKFGQNSNAVMQETSVSGVEILRILSLSIRTEQDHGRIDGRTFRVGDLLTKATPIQIDDAIRSRQASNADDILTLREALNKIAHANPNRSTYRIDDDDHVLILTGKNKDENWIAELSIPKLCDAILQLKDDAVRS